MDVFNSRISLDESAETVQLALRRELLSGHSAAIFHHLGLMRARIEELQVCVSGEHAAHDRH